MTEVIKFAHLATNNQLSTSNIYFTTSANKKWDRLPNDYESWGGQGCRWPISSSWLELSWYWGYVRSVLKSSNPPISLMIGRVFVTSCRIIAICRLIIKHCISLLPLVDSIFEIKPLLGIKGEINIENSNRTWKSYYSKNKENRNAGECW